MKLRHYFLTLLACLFLSLPAHAGSASYQPRVNYDITATIVIATSTTVSPAVDLYGTTLVGIFVPAEFDGTTMTLSAATAIDGTYYPVQLSVAAATLLTITTTASQYIPMTPVNAGNMDFLAGMRYFKITTGSAQTTTNTVFTLATIPTR